MMIVSFELGLQVAIYINLLLQTLHRPPVNGFPKLGNTTSIEITIFAPPDRWGL